ncbi:hypothetical protein GOBAR_DD20477 [Gossypium barbadense]|nr:hypothetical protein GOBAR_DD20477 [Gossypium barbadense]
MELVEDEDVETMVAGTQSNKNAPIQLFVELAGVEATEDPTPLGEEDGVQAPCMVVPVSYVDSQSTIHGINIDLNAAAETDVVGDNVYYSSDPVDYEVDSESDPDVDEVPDNIDDEGVNEDGNVNASSVRNQIRHIVVHNNLGAHMSRIDPDAARAAEFPEYPEILPANQIGVYSDPEELRGLPSTAHQTEMVSLSHSTTVYTLTKAANPEHDPSECQDILYATELPEYSIAMIPLHYVKIDNGCVNAP